MYCWIDQMRLPRLTHLVMAPGCHDLLVRAAVSRDERQLARFARLCPTGCQQCLQQQVFAVVGCCDLGDRGYRCLVFFVSRWLRIFGRCRFGLHSTDCCYRCPNGSRWCFARSLVRHCCWQQVYRLPGMVQARLQMMRLTLSAVVLPGSVRDCQLKVVQCLIAPM